MRASVPASAAHNEYQVFPAGTYEGKIAGAEIRESENSDWTGVRVQISDVAPREGTDDPGRSRFTDSVTIRYDGVSLLDTPYSQDLPFGVQRGYEILAGLAEGLGVAQENGDGNLVFDTEDLIEALVEGTFEGEGISFEVENWENKNGEAQDGLRVVGPAS